MYKRTLCYFYARVSEIYKIQSLQEKLQNFTHDFYNCRSKLVVVLSYSVHVHSHSRGMHMCVNARLLRPHTGTPILKRGPEILEL